MTILKARDNTYKGSRKIFSFFFPSLFPSAVPSLKYWVFSLKGYPPQSEVQTKYKELFEFLQVSNSKEKEKVIPL